MIAISQGIPRFSSSSRLEKYPSIDSQNDHWRHRDFLRYPFRPQFGSRPSLKTQRNKLQALCPFCHLEIYTIQRLISLLYIVCAADRLNCNGNCRSRGLQSGLISMLLRGVRFCAKFTTGKGGKPSGLNASPRHARSQRPSRPSPHCLHASSKVAAPGFRRRRA